MPDADPPRDPDAGPPIATGATREAISIPDPPPRRDPVPASERSTVEADAVGVEAQASTGDVGDTTQAAVRAAAGNAATVAPKSKGGKGKRPRRLGPFTLGRRVGVGGMGVVYAALYQDPKKPDAAGRPVAVKVLTPGLVTDPKVRRRFGREMDIFKKLRHPKIVRYFGGGTSGGTLFYAMELMPGGSVEDRLRKDGPVDWRRAADIAAQVAEGLHHAHERGITHRDLKPANLFFDEAGGVKLGDFGIARDGNATALTAAGRTVGTYAYMAPEQISAAREVGPKTDLYALGCVLHELLTGEPPFRADNPATLLHAHLSTEPPRVRGVDCPVWLADLTQSLLAKKEADRPFDALAVHTMLTEEAEAEARRSVVGRTAAGELPARRSATANLSAAQAREEARKERDAARSVLGRTKKKKRRAAGPLWERPWVLGLALLLLLGGAGFAVYRTAFKGERELYEGAKALMASDDVDDWRTARDDYITPLLARFPDSEHAAEARGWADRFEVDLLRRQLRRQLTSFVAQPDNELERQYLEVEKLADFGDYWSAADRVATLQDLLKDNAFLEREDIGEDGARHWGLLLAQRDAELEAEIAGDRLGRQRFVEDSLRAAERAFQAGRVGEARGKWNGVVEFYAGFAELAPHVAWANARLAGQFPPPPPWLTEPAGEDESPT